MTPNVAKAAVRLPREVFLPLLREVFLPRGPEGYFLVIPGTASLLSLAKDGFNFGLGPIFQKMLSHYDWLVDQIIGWAKPCIEWALAAVNLNIDLQPHWKHVFVLFNIYLVRSVMNSWKVHRPTGIFRLAIAILISASVSIGAGAIPLIDQSVISNLAVVGIPILGLFAYGVLTGLWLSIFRNEIEVKRRGQSTRVGILVGHLVAAARRTAIAFVIALVGLLSPLSDRVPSPGLAVLAILVLLHALYNLREGRSQLVREPWHQSYWETPSTRLGIDMLRYFAWATVIVALGAGSPS